MYVVVFIQSQLVDLVVETAMLIPVCSCKQTSHMLALN